MRPEILYRGYDCEQKKWVFGTLFMSKDSENAETAIIITNPALNSGEDRTLVFHQGDYSIVHRDSLGQCTGRLDRVRKPIFEGDIVNLADDQKSISISFKGEPQEVFWDKSRHNFRFRSPSNKEATKDITAKWYEMEICGNAFERKYDISTISPASPQIGDQNQSYPTSDYWEIEILKIFRKFAKNDTIDIRTRNQKSFWKRPVYRWKLVDRKGIEQSMLEVSVRMGLKKKILNPSLFPNKKEAYRAFLNMVINYRHDIFEAIADDNIIQQIFPDKMVSSYQLAYLYQIL